METKTRKILQPVTEIIYVKKDGHSNQVASFLNVRGLKVPIKEAWIVSERRAKLGVLGIRTRSIWANEGLHDALQHERLYDAVGLEANWAANEHQEVRNDFNDYFPYAHMQPVTLSGRSMIRVPKFYIRRRNYDGWEEIVIAGHKFDAEAFPHEAFLKPGIAYLASDKHSEDDYNGSLYVGRYETVNGNQSLPGKPPTTNTTYEDFRSNAQSLGDGWDVIDKVIKKMFQELSIVVFGRRWWYVYSAMAQNRPNTTPISTGRLSRAKSSVVLFPMASGETGSLFYGVENLMVNTLTSGLDSLPHGAAIPGGHPQLTDHINFSQIFNEALAFGWQPRISTNLEEIQRRTSQWGAVWETSGHGTLNINTTLRSSTKISVTNAIVKVHVNFVPLARNTPFTQNNDGNFAPNSTSQQIINDLARLNDSGWTAQYMAYEAVRHFNGKIFGVSGGNAPLESSFTITGTGTATNHFLDWSVGGAVINVPGTFTVDLSLPAHTAVSVSLEVLSRKNIEDMITNPYTEPHFLVGSRLIFRPS